MQIDNRGKVIESVGCNAGNHTDDETEVCRQQGIAVRVGLEDRFGAGDHIAAVHIFNGECFAGRFRQVLGNQSGQHIGTAACGQVAYDGNGVFGILFGFVGARAICGAAGTATRSHSEKHTHCQNHCNRFFHFCFSFLFVYFSPFRRTIKHKSASLTPLSRLYLPRWGGRIRPCLLHKAISSPDILPDSL